MDLQFHHRTSKSTELISSKSCAEAHKNQRVGVAGFCFAEKSFLHTTSISIITYIVNKFMFLSFIYYFFNSYHFSMYLFMLELFVHVIALEDEVNDEKIISFPSERNRWFILLLYSIAYFIREVCIYFFTIY